MVRYSGTGPDQPGSAKSETSPVHGSTPSLNPDGPGKYQKTNNARALSWKVVHVHPITHAWDL